MAGDELPDRDAVRAWLAQHVYGPRLDAPPVGAVGLEYELLPFWLSGDGRPAARLAVVELVAIIDAVDGAVRRPDSPGGRPSWDLDGALITEEPGGQLEIAGPPEPDTAHALGRLERITGRLTRAFADAGAGLGAAGLDLWSAPDEVPVQLDVPRYAAMSTYWDRRGGRHGYLLMCSSCSMQVNVDLGPPDVARRRWLAANLIAPVLTAAFAASPTADARNGRALGWRQLDPTRTGVAPSLRAGHDEDPLVHVLDDALRADVMMVERDGRWEAGHPGWSFGDWVDDGHPRYGAPTADDLRTHLTTLFPEARLRGFLEIRGLDALPAPWHAASVAAVVGALYDDQAMDGVLEVMRPHRAVLDDLLERAARHGLDDPLLGALSVEVLGHALAGAERHGVPHASVLADFLDRFTRQGRHPGDELADALREGPAAAWRWAAVAS